MARLICDLFSVVELGHCASAGSASPRNQQSKHEVHKSHKKFWT